MWAWDNVQRVDYKYTITFSFGGPKPPGKPVEINECASLNVKRVVRIKFGAHVGV